MNKMQSAKKEYVCERCGKTRPEHVKMDFQLGSNRCRDIGWIRLCAGSGYRRDVDLCESCMEELAEWMEGPAYVIATPLNS